MILTTIFLVVGTNKVSKVQMTSFYYLAVLGPVSSTEILVLLLVPVQRWSVPVLLEEPNITTSSFPQDELPLTSPLVSIYLNMVQLK